MSQTIPLDVLDEARPSKWRRLGRWPVPLAVALGVLATVEATSALVAPRRVATDADWDAAAGEVRAGFRPGDLIVFAPRWADQVGRLHLGDLIPVEMAARADASGYARIWEVSIRGARADETRAPGVVPLGAHDHGRVHVALFQKPAPAPVLFDFTASLAEARVTQVVGAGEELPQGRAERRVLEVDYQPRLGVLVPVDRGRVTRITFEGVPLGARLAGHTGMHDYYARKNASGPVEFAVFIDGEPVQSVLQRNEDGWRAFNVDTARWSGGRHQVRFEVESAQPDWRNFGFAARSLGETAPGGAP